MKWLLAAKARAAQAPTRRVRFVVVEHGAGTFDSYMSSDESEETVVVGQADGEPLLQLSHRVLQRIAGVERSARHISQAILLIAPLRDENSMAARRLIASALLTHAQAGPAGSAELLLAVSGDAEIALRHGLMELVETLVSEPGSASVQIRIRFGSGNSPSVVPGAASGVWLCPRPEEELARLDAPDEPAENISQGT